MSGYDETAVFVLREVLLFVLRISIPILGAGLIMGLLISLLQSVTSMQDQTMTFVPKFIVMLGVAVMLLPWIGQRLVEFAAEMFRLF